MTGVEPATNGLGNHCSILSATPVDDLIIPHNEKYSQVKTSKSLHL